MNNHNIKLLLFLKHILKQLKNAALSRSCLWDGRGEKELRQGANLNSGELKLTSHLYVINTNLIEGE